MQAACYPGAVAQRGSGAGEDMTVDDRDARIAQLEVDLRHARRDAAALRERAEVAEAKVDSQAADANRHDRALAESQAQQAATAEILRIIANAPADAQPVLDDVALHAARLCDAADAQIWRVESGELRKLAAFGTLPMPIAVGATVPLSRDSVAGCAVLDRATVHVPHIDPDKLADAPMRLRINARQWGVRCVVAVPMLCEGVALACDLTRSSASPSERFGGCSMGREPLLMFRRLS